MASRDARQAALNHFLMTRRSLIVPQSVGIASAPRRRSVGLRRDEVATLAGISVEWYTRIERGFAERVGTATLDAIARVLSLEPHERDYFYTLASRSTAPSNEPVNQGVLDLLKCELAVPVILSTAYFTPIGWNSIAGRLLHLSTSSSILERNICWRLLFQREQVSTDLDEEQIAQMAAGTLRRASALLGGDADLEKIIQALLANAAFESAWNRHVVETYPTPRYFLSGGRISLRTRGNPEIELRPLWLTIQDQPEYLLAFHAPASETALAGIGQSKSMSAAGSKGRVPFLS